MAAIKIKRSSVPAKVPVTADIELGELAVNTYDGKLYLKKNNGTESVIEVANVNAPTFTGNVTATGNLVSANSSGDEGGEILLAKPQTNSTIAGTGVTIDIWQNRLRFFEQGGSARGFYIDLTTGGAGVGTNLVGGGIGTVTSVGGTGTVSGLTLTGTVTSSGNLTLGGTLTLTSTQVTNGLGFTPYDATNPSGYITSAALTSYLTTTSAASTYAALAGATFTGAVGLSDQNLTRTMLKDQGYAYFNSNTTNALDFVNGSYQRWAPTASSNPTLTISNWPPSGNLGEMLVEAVNLAAAGTVTYPAANWIKSDGTFAASPSAGGVTFQSAGTDFILFWTRDAGTTIYAKVVR